jgi:putative serine protease PepD
MTMNDSARPGGQSPWWSRPDVGAEGEREPFRYDEPVEEPTVASELQRTEPAEDADTIVSERPATDPYDAQRPTQPQAPVPGGVGHPGGASPYGSGHPGGGQYGGGQYGDPSYGGQGYGGYGGPGYPHPAPQPPAPKRRLARAALAGATLVAVALGSGYAGAQFADDDPATTGSSVLTAPANTRSGGDAPTEQLAQVAASVQPSVVSIAVQGQGGAGTGSGVVLRSDGTILTNNHVVESAANGGAIQVKFSNGDTADAEILGRDPSTDLAVIKAEGVEGLQPATLGSVADVHVGDMVLAIGSPLGLEGSVSMGIVSALNRPVVLGSSRQEEQPFNPFGNNEQPQQTTTALTDAIQTDAAINPGNSGGALVDAEGRVIGINTAIATTNVSVSGEAGSIGLGFAIPIDQASDVAEALINGEEPTHAVLGVQTTNSPEGDGAVVAGIVEGSAAEQAGLRNGDRITAVDDRRIEDATALAATIRGMKPGTEVQVTFVRDGDEQTVTATLGSAS